MKNSKIIQYLIYSSITALTLLMGSLITLAVYDVKNIPEFINRLEERIEGYEGSLFFETEWSDTPFVSNLNFQLQANQEEYYNVTTYDFSSGQSILVETDVISADVTVEMVAGQTISVEIYTKKPDRYRIEQSTSSLLVEEKRKTEIFCLFGCESEKATIKIKIPQSGSHLDLQTINGDIKVSHLGDYLEAMTVNGTIEVEKSHFVDLVLEATNGKIKLNDSTVEKEANLTVVNGSILVNQLASERIEAETVNGDVMISDIEGDHLDLSTINGDFDLRNIYMNDIEVDKVNGDFTLVNDDLTYQIQSLNLSGLKKNYEIEANVLKISYN